MNELDFIVGLPFMRRTGDCAAGAARAPARPAAEPRRKRSLRWRARRAVTGLACVAPWVAAPAP